MTETDAAADRFTLVPGAHRLIRAIDAKEGPFAGTLVTYGDGVAVVVPIDRLAQWPGWTYSDAEHVCGVLDLRRRADGHDALLPWCTQRVESFLGRRQIADAPLVPGELGTLVASMLRGLRELGGEEAASGDWWLTGDGRPIFVHGDGGAPRSRTASLVERAAQHTADRATIRIIDEIVAALRQTRHHVGDESRWEAELFAIAAPRALRLDVFAPERVSGAGVQRMVSAQAMPATRAERRQRKDDGGTHRLRELFIASREQLSRAVSLLDRRENKRAQTPSKPSRRRSLLLAGGLGAAVLAVGLMWPSGGAEDDAEAASRPATVPVAPSDTPEEPLEGDDALGNEEPLGGDEALDDGEALEALPSLLSALQQCVDDSASTCPEALTEQSQIPSAGVVVQGADASSAVLVEDYGDVAVVRLTPEAEGAEQMLVLERHNELWLLRDVYDVAK